MSGAGDRLLVFEHTEDMFDKYLIQRKLYDAWQTGLVLAEAMNMESFFWITLLRAQEVRMLVRVFPFEPITKLPTSCLTCAMFTG